MRSGNQYIFAIVGVCLYAYTAWSTDYKQYIRAYYPKKIMHTISGGIAGVYGSVLPQVLNTAIPYDDFAPYVGEKEYTTFRTNALDQASTDCIHSIGSYLCSNSPEFNYTFAISKTLCDVYMSDKAAPASMSHIRKCYHAIAGASTAALKTIGIRRLTPHCHSLIMNYVPSSCQTSSTWNALLYHASRLTLKGIVSGYKTCLQRWICGDEPWSDHTYRISQSLLASYLEHHARTGQRNRVRSLNSTQQVPCNRALSMYRREYYSPMRRTPMRRN